MKIKHTSFGGIIPKLEPRNLPENAAQVAQNVWICEQNLQPIKTVSTTQALADALQESIYLWRRGGSSEWLSWNKDVNVCQAPIADDQYATLYYTDGTTLHRIRWISDAKVENADVSVTKPAAPSITKQDVIDLTTITGSAYLPSNAKFSDLISQGATLVENVLTVKGYYFNTSGSTSLYYKMTGSYTLPSAPGSISLRIGESKALSPFGSLKMMSATTEIDYTLSQTSGPTTTYATVVTIIAQLDFARSSSNSCYYVQSSIDAYGQESPPSDVSALVELSPNQYAIIGNAAGRIYRSATGNNADGFFFLADGTGTVNDTSPDAYLSERMPLIENPPISMYGLVSVPGGFYVAFKGKDIYMSEPFLPYSWPTRYRLTMDYDVIGLAVNGNDVVVVTEGNPYILSGSHPNNISQSKISVEQACVSKRSIAFAQHFVCYASPDGLVSIAGGQVKVLTAPFYTRDQWQALTPSGMIGSVHDNRYIGFVATGGIILDFEEPNQALTTTDQTAQGAFADLENDQLYLIQSSNVVEWRGSASYLTGTWKSREYQTVKHAFPTSAKVIAATYTGINFRLYADGALVWSYTVTNSNGFRLPKQNRSARWSYDVETVDEIYDIRVASSMQELR